MPEAIFAVLLLVVLVVPLILLWRKVSVHLRQTNQDIQQALIASQDAVNRNLQFHSQALDKLQNQLGKLEGANQRILDIGGDLKGLQQIFASPKLRGGFGEWQLENILSSVLPADSFQMQHTFRDGKKVDALIRMPKFAVPVDAKFPLENFKKFQAEQNQVESEKLRRDFMRDVKKHIDKIADSYIRPDEGTVDFSLMFVPAENVYYEAIAGGGNGADIADYSMSRKVFPVSPNLLYVYLMTVAMGLHGLQIERQAEEIRRNLKSLNALFGEFFSLWDTLGGHLRNASGKYDEGQKKLDKLTMQLQQIQNEKTDK